MNYSAQVKKNVYPPALNKTSNSEVVDVFADAVTDKNIDSINDYMNPATYTKLTLHDNVINTNLLHTADHNFLTQYDETSNEGGFSPVSWNGGVLNALPSVSTCLGVPIFMLGMLGYTGGDLYLPGAIKFTAKQLINNLGNLPPELVESDFGDVKFHTIYKLYSVKDGDTFANKLFKWFGQDSTGVVDFSNVKDIPFLYPRCKLIYDYISISKIEKAQQYGLLDLKYNYMANLISNSNEIIRDYSVIEYLDFTAWGELSKQIILSTINQAREDNPTATNQELIDVWYPGLFYQSRGTSWATFGYNPYFDNQDPNTTCTHFVNQIQMILFHQLGSLYMCEPDVLSDENITFFKNAKIPILDRTSLDVVDLDWPLDFTRLDRQVFKNLPELNNLYIQCCNSNIVLNKYTIGQTPNTFDETLAFNAMMNAYVKIYENIKKNKNDNTPLYTVDELENIVRGPAFFTLFVRVENAYRTTQTSPENNNDYSVNVFCEPVLMQTDVENLNKICNAIAIDILTHYNNVHPTLNYQLAPFFVLDNFGLYRSKEIQTNLAGYLSQP